MPSTSRAALFLGTAAAVHLAVLLSIRLRSSEPRPVLAESARVEPNVELDVMEDAPARTVATSRPNETEFAHRSTEGTTTRGANPERGATRAEGSPEPAPEPTAPESPSSDWTFDARRPLDVTAPSFIARATQHPSAEAAPAGASTSGGLVEGLDEADVAHDQGRSGPVLSALEAAAGGIDAPFAGHATFDVTVDTTGRVSVSVLDASSGFEGWSKVAEAARGTVVPAHVRIPPGARGWHVVARLEAKEQYPNGVTPKMLGPKAEGTWGHIRETKDRIDIQLPQATLSTAGKVCAVGITIGLVPSISGSCNPENIGAHLERVVSGHVISEGRL